jgi:hypothetical protein
MVAESQDVVPAARKRREESGGGGALVASPAGAAVVHRKRRKGVNMPVVRTASGVDIETPVPTLYCAVAMWPFEERYWERVSRTRNMQAWRAIEIFLPATIYPSSPQSFWDMNNEHIDMCNMYKAALSMIFYAAYLSVSPRVRRPEDDDDDVPAELSVNKSVATVERVPARHDSTVFVGFRVRVTEHALDRYNAGMEGDVAHALKVNQTQSFDNTRVGAKKKFGGGGGGGLKNAAPLPSWSHKRVDLDEWKRICVKYAPKYVSEAIAAGHGDVTNLCSNDSPYNIANVFSVQRSLEKALAEGADPRYCDAAIYCPPERDATRGFADPRNVWQVPIDQFDPVKMPLRHMPWIGQDERLYAEQAAAWYRLNGIDPDDPDAPRFAATCNHTSNTTVVNDISALQARISDERKDLRHAHYSNPNAHALTLRQKKVEWIKQLSEIMSPTGCVATSIQSIARWKQLYLRANDNTFCMPRDLAFSNLTPFGNAMAMYAIMYETVVAVKDSHARCFTYLLCAYHVFARTPMNPHCLLLGPPGIGKSFALMILFDLLIKGTVRKLTYMTAKALAAEGKQNDCLVMVRSRVRVECDIHRARTAHISFFVRGSQIFEDAPASMLGVQSANKSGGAAASTDTENMVKQFLTSMTVSVQTLSIEDGKRITEFITAECSCVCFFAMNEPTSVFPTAILSRCYVVVNSSTADADPNAPESTTNMNAKAQRVSDAAVKEAANDFKTYLQRNQALVADILYAAAGGALHQINIDAAQLLFSMVATRAKTCFGLNMTNPRDYERFLCLCRVLCVLDAISKLWDSPLSPLRDQPHSDLHILLAEKHLVVTVEVAVFAIGLLSGQWENALRGDVLRVMRKKWFPKSNERLEQMRKPVLSSELDAADAPEPVAPDGVWVPEIASAARPPSEAKRKRDEKKMAEVMKNDVARTYFEEKAEYDGMQEQRKHWMYDSLAWGEGQRLKIPTVQTLRGSNNDLYAYLAKQLVGHMHPKPLESEVQAILQRMGEENEDAARRIIEYEGDPGSDDLQEKSSDAVFVVDPEFGVRLHLCAIDRSADVDMLYKATRDVVTALHDATCKRIRKANRAAVAAGCADEDLQPVPPVPTYLFGQTETNSPYVWRTIQADPSVDGAFRAKKLPRVWNPNFYEGSLQHATDVFLGGITNESDAERALRNKRLFSSATPWLTIDMSLDEYAAQTHAADLMLSHADQHAAPSNVPLAEDAARHADARARGLRLDSYPECFERRDPKTWIAGWEATAADHPERFAMSARNAALKAAQKELLPLPPLPFEFGFLRPPVVAQLPPPPPVPRLPPAPARAMLLPPAEPDGGGGALAALRRMQIADVASRATTDEEDPFDDDDDDYDAAVRRKNAERRAMERQPDSQRTYDEYDDGPCDMDLDYDGDAAVEAELERLTRPR